MENYYGDPLVTEGALATVLLESGVFGFDKSKLPEETENPPAADGGEVIPVIGGCIGACIGAWMEPCITNGRFVGTADIGCIITIGCIMAG